MVSYIFLTECCRSGCSVERQELPQLGFLIYLSKCWQEHGPCVVSHSTAGLAVPGKVLSGTSCCMGTFYLYYFLLLPETVLENLSSYSVLEQISLFHTCRKWLWQNTREYRKEGWYLFMKSPNELPSCGHSLIYFIHFSFHPYPHKPQDAKVVRLTHDTKYMGCWTLTTSHGIFFICDYKLLFGQMF